MNAKLCKQLRRVAAGLSKTPVTERRYQKFQSKPTFKNRDPGFIVSLDPGCGRAAYHRLKKEVRG